MKLAVSPKSGRNVELICIWDGPFINEVLYIAPGRDIIIFPVQGEKPSFRVCYFTDSAFETNEPSYMGRLYYYRTDKEDDEGRVYFAMRQL